jgi:hypothetical protein
MIGEKTSVKWVEVGKNYLIRTVTMIYTGQVVEEHLDHFVLEKAAWIADAGRWADVIKSCDFDEVEPYPADRKVIVTKGGVLDTVEISTLPLEQK